MVFAAPRPAQSHNNMFRQGCLFKLMTLKTTMLSFIASSLFLLSSVGCAAGHSCSQTLHVHEDCMTAWKEIPPCDDHISCCGSEEQNITAISQTPHGIDLIPQGDRIDVVVNLEEISFNQSVRLAVQYTYNCIGQVQNDCQGHGPFTQPMSLIIQLISVNIITECENCTNSQATLYISEGTPMKLRCSTNFAEYWTEFIATYADQELPRKAPCEGVLTVSENSRHSVWNTYRDPSNNECILEMPECNMQDMGTYSCAIFIRINNHDEQFRSEELHIVPLDYALVSAAAVSTSDPHLDRVILSTTTGVFVLTTIILGLIVIALAVYVCWIKRQLRRPPDENPQPPAVEGGGREPDQQPLLDEEHGAAPAAYGAAPPREPAPQLGEKGG